MSNDPILGNPREILGGSDPHPSSNAGKNPTNHVAAGGFYWKAQSSESEVRPARTARREDRDKQVRKTLQSPASGCSRLEEEETPGVPRGANPQERTVKTQPVEGRKTQVQMESNESKSHP